MAPPIAMLWVVHERDLDWLVDRFDQLLPLYDTESEEAAIEWSPKIPNARNGSVEVRRVDEGDLAERMAAAADPPR